MKVNLIKRITVDHKTLCIWHRANASSYLSPFSGGEGCYKAYIMRILTMQGQWYAFGNAERIRAQLNSLLVGGYQDGKYVLSAFNVWAENYQTMDCEQKKEFEKLVHSAFEKFDSTDNLKLLVILAHNNLLSASYYTRMYLDSIIYKLIYNRMPKFVPMIRGDNRFIPKLEDVVRFWIYYCFEQEGGLTNNERYCLAQMYDQASVRVKDLALKNLSDQGKALMISIFTETSHFSKLYGDLDEEMQEKNWDRIKGQIKRIAVSERKRLMREGGVDSKNAFLEMIMPWLRNWSTGKDINEDQMRCLSFVLSHAYDTLSINELLTKVNEGSNVAYELSGICGYLVSINNSDEDEDDIAYLRMLSCLYAFYSTPRPEADTFFFKKLRELCNLKMNTAHDWLGLRDEIMALSEQKREEQLAKILDSMSDIVLHDKSRVFEVLILYLHGETKGAVNVCEEFDDELNTLKTYFEYEGAALTEEQTAEDEYQMALARNFQYYINGNSNSNSNSNGNRNCSLADFREKFDVDGKLSNTEIEIAYLKEVSENTLGVYDWMSIKADQHLELIGLSLLYNCVDDFAETKRIFVKLIDTLPDCSALKTGYNKVVEDFDFCSIPLLLLNYIASIPGDVSMRSTRERYLFNFPLSHEQDNNKSNFPTRLEFLGFLEIKLKGFFAAQLKVLDDDQVYKMLSSCIKIISSSDVDNIIHKFLTQGIDATQGNEKIKLLKMIDQQLIDRISSDNDLWLFFQLICFDNVGARDVQIEDKKLDALISGVVSIRYCDNQTALNIKKLMQLKAFQLKLQRSIEISWVQSDSLPPVFETCKDYKRQILHANNAQASPKALKLSLHALYINVVTMFEFGAPFYQYGQKRLFDEAKKINWSNEQSANRLREDLLRYSKVINISREFILEDLKHPEWQCFFLKCRKHTQI